MKRKERESEQTNKGGSREEKIKRRLADCINFFVFLFSFLDFSSL